MKMGVLATINQVLDEDTAVLVVEEMGHKIEVVAKMHSNGQCLTTIKSSRAIDRLVLQL